MLDLHDPFFKPLWLRIALVAICLAWAVFELSNEAYVWSLIFATMGVVAAYHFFINWPKGS